MGITAKPRSLSALDKRADPAHTSMQIDSEIESAFCSLINFPGTADEDWADSPNDIESGRFEHKIGKPLATTSSGADELVGCATPMDCQTDEQACMG